MSSLLFLALLFVVLGPCHWYVYRRMVSDPSRPGRLRLAGIVALTGFAGCVLFAFSRRVRDFVPPGPARLTLMLVGYVWLALLVYLVFSLLLLEIPRRVAVRKSEPVDEGRRLLIARSTAIVAGLAAGSTVGYGVASAYRTPALKRIQIPLAKLPRSLDGYRIGLVSDIHMGPLTGVGRTRRIVEAVNSLNADLIAVVGDLVDGPVAELRDQALPLRDLSSKDGVFFVTGNHEYYSGVDEWLREIVELGMRPLRNERLEIRGLDLAGVDDYGAAPDYAAALSGRDPAKPVVLLAHQPVAVTQAAKYGVDLQLSGHTHGGQIFPFHFVVASQQPLLSGLAEIDGTKVYVTNGAGFWGPPVRVGAPNDITLVELRAT
ncbi:metallophosphatase [Rhizocola hellebori]|uniref:Metallophosphatase n=1 Tax=Rhizocola hellebori TaxID=1392758 RepID=A0A8J3Q9M7_9ACTN|nr:metallophosphoesterase [Rhizocola hellebori]GIH05600.1 metallophosphatase [Rhizocola hellebori]